MTSWPDNQVATIRAYDSDAARYAEESRDHTGLSRLRAHLIALLPPEPFILDLGSGPGHDAALLCALGANVVCVDPAIELLAQGHKSVSIASRLVGGEACRLPFADQAFDGIWSCASLLHVPHPDVPLALAEVRRVLKPGGVAFFSMSEGEPEVALPDESRGLATRYYFYHRDEEWAALIAAQGFEIVSHVANRSAGKFNLESTAWLETFARKPDSSTAGP